MGNGTAYGVMLSGIFMGAEEVRPRSDGQQGPARCRCGIGCGMQTYQLYFDLGFLAEFKAHRVTEELLVRARPYVTKSGYLGWADPQIVYWGGDGESVKADVRS